MISAIIVSFDYTDSSVENLQSSINDVTLISSLLEKEYIDYKIIGSLNLKGKLVKWKNKIDPDIVLKHQDNLILYITGHGDKNGCILWGDKNNLKSINDIIKDYNVKKIWIILDVCYSHLIFEKFLSETIIERKNIFCLLSTSEKNPVALSTNRGSIFTVNLYNKIYDSDKKIIEHF